MSFMLKIAFALQVTVAAAVGHGTSTSTSAPTESAPTESAPIESAPTEQSVADPVLNRASCDVCYEIYDSCIAEGISPAGCQRLSANCFRTCLP